MLQDELFTLARDAMLQRGLLADFSPAALLQLQAMSAPRLQVDSTIRDQRRLLWCSIDNDDSRDLDQLTVAQELADGAVRVLVAIADVDVLVKPDTAIDRHAAINTTSVYTAARTFPMLPERLSTDLTSLNEAEDRLAIVVDMSIAADGIVNASDVSRAIVRSAAQLAYNGVAAWLDGVGPAPARLASVPGLDKQLQLQDRIAQSLKRMRH